MDQIMWPLCFSRRIAVPFFIVVTASTSWSQSPGWTSDFALPGLNDGVKASVVFDDGGGPALYVGGDFVNAGGRPAKHIAKWNGATWSSVGGGISDQVRALAVFDDGTGPALYAAGWFAQAGTAHVNSIAKWNGTSWSALGAGLQGVVDSLGVFDDGHGSALYAGGEFASAGGAPAKNIAKWDGNHWSALGSGLTPVYGVASLYSMCVFDDGSGQALYVAGAFSAVNGVPARFIARWNGSAWFAVGSGSRSFCYALAVLDDGSGPALYAAGGFNSESEHAFHAFGKWTGSAWQPMGPVGEHVFASSFGVYDDGSASALYVGFQRSEPGSAQLMCGVGRWDGSRWTTIASNLVEAPSTFAAFDDGRGNSLFVGGRFTRMGSVSAGRIARWRINDWSSVGVAPGAGGMDGPVKALLVFDDGSGPALFAAGKFSNAGGVVASNIAKWNGTGWRNLGAGTDGVIKALAVFNDGTGAALYAGGDFWKAGGLIANGLAKWNGTSWSVIGSSSLSGDVRSLCAFDDGSGAALFAGGLLLHHGIPGSDSLAKWNGQSWTGVGVQLNGGSVDAMASFDDGHGPALFIGGDFAAFEEHGIAKWDGVRLSSVDHGWYFNANVKALKVFDDGSGPALYVGGEIDAYAISERLNGVARWDGHQWISLQSGLEGTVQSLTTFDDGSGPALYAGCWVAGNPFGFDSHSLARWSATGWSVVGNGFSSHEFNSISASTVFDAGDGPELYVAGDFTMADGVPASHIARWRVH
jgi:hypothetical protein